MSPFGSHFGVHTADLGPIPRGPWDRLLFFCKSKCWFSVSSMALSDAMGTQFQPFFIFPSDVQMLSASHPAIYSPEEKSDVPAG